MVIFPTFLEFRIHGSPMCQCQIMPCPWSIQCACDDASIQCKGKDVSHKVVMLSWQHQACGLQTWDPPSVLPPKFACQIVSTPRHGCQPTQTQLPDSILLHECKTSKGPVQGNLQHPRDADVQRKWCIVGYICHHQ